MHWLTGGDVPRLGLAVSRKVSPDAVVRNRIKRALREEFRRIRNALPGGDYVLVARHGAAGHCLLVVWLTGRSISCPGMRRNAPIY